MPHIIGTKDQSHVLTLISCDSCSATRGYTNTNTNKNTVKLVKLVKAQYIHCSNSEYRNLQQGVRSECAEIIFAIDHSAVEVSVSPALSHYSTDDWDARLKSLYNENKTK
jgi:hypothetical protein